MLASRVRKARRAGTCVLCQHLISTGQQIGKTRQGWAHTACVIAAQQHARIDAAYANNA